MYYNIKIKSKDSELALESDNKDITQKEMDIYFAYFFDVSDAYSKRVQEMIKSTESKVCETTPILHPELSIQENLADNISNISENPQPNLNIPTEEKEETLKDIALLTNSTFRDANDSSDIFATPTTLVPTPTYYQDIQTLASSIAPLGCDITVPAYNYDEYKNNDLSKIFMEQSGILQRAVVKPSVTVEAIDGVTYVEAIDSRNDTDNCDNSLFAEIPASEILKAEEVVDFKTYLSKFSISEIEDEFIICAHYIKNVLKKDSFSLKQINAELFSATERIVDTNMMNNFVENNYIDCVDMNDVRLYSITLKGEGYFEYIRAKNLKS